MCDDTAMLIQAAAPTIPGDLRFVEAAAGSVEFMPVEAADGAAPKSRKFAMTAYTGGAMSLGFGAPVVIDLAGMTVTRQDLPILRQHDAERIVGHSTQVDVTAQRIKVAGLISGTGEAAQEVTATAGNGFPWQASVGAAAHQTEFVEQGQTVKVNGRSFTGPLIVARKTTLREVSFVPLGADGATSATVTASHKGLFMQFDAWVKAKGFDPASLTADQTATLRAAFDAEQKPKPPGDPVADMNATIAGNYKRIAAINAACGTEFADVAAEAVAGGWSEDKVARVVAEKRLEKLRAERPNPTTIVGSSGRVGAEVLEAAVIQAASLPGELRAKMEKGFTESTLEAAHKRYKGRIGLQQLLIEAAYANGYTGPANFKGNHADILRAAFSGGDISGILSNTANKFLLAGYMAVEQAWAAVSSRRPASDFKTMTSYRMTGGFKYEKIAANGTIPHGTVGEESYTNKVDTYAKMFAITRQDQRNDDLGALTDLPRKIGRGAGLSLNDVFWTAWLDDSAFFTSGNNNYISGPTTNLSSAGLTAGVQKFRKQTDPDGNPLGLAPVMLLVPPELEQLAAELYASTNVNTGGAAATEKVPNVNVHAAKYKPVVSTYLSNSSYTGYSATGWYLLASPDDEPVIEVAFLDGQESPTVEAADTDFSTLGIQMRGFHDFGVTKQSTRGAVKSKGAA
jgi:hypothetical protein